MLELTPTDIALLNSINNLLLRILSASGGRWYNFAAVHFGTGVIGARSHGCISFGVGNKRDCGELEFRGLEDCIHKLEEVLSWAAKGRMD